MLFALNTYIQNRSLLNDISFHLKKQEKFQIPLKKQTTRFIQEEIDNAKSPISINDIEFGVLTLLTRKIPLSDALTGKSYQTFKKK